MDKYELLKTPYYIEFLSGGEFYTIHANRRTLKRLKRNKNINILVIEKISKNIFNDYFYKAIYTC